MMLKTLMWGWRLAVGGLVLLLAGCAGTAGMEGVVALLPSRLTRRVGMPS